ncbi:ammonium transporter [Dactylosporangium sucinum]|uniref:Ammonium transporter n=1 Tax=Dactylosporangium sucinum TaxID=1424081 RepID=A0A917TTN4_9ACTN|nr:ammonium transporter [Dactylosporangium sucinum]GGM37664.1 ammonium transporter [Dactylosporangium sucinum]
MPGATDPGATAWVLASAALVLLMTPGVAFFYGGMVRRNNVLGIIMQSFATLAIVTITWVTVGFTIAFAPGNEFLGDLRWLGLSNPTGEVGAAPHVPVMVFALYQLMFAAVTPALITGSTAERWRFGPFCAFIALWSVLVYAPIAHWVFAPEGWAARWGALDFAGGTVVHANAGAAALAMAIVLGRRRGWPANSARPHNLPMVMTGLALLWFGWLGFNGGSAYGANQLAGTATVNTMVAASAALMAWSVTERARYGKATSLGAASGVVAGLVAITPAAGYVAPIGALAIGTLAGLVCHLLVGLKVWFRVDDSLDVAAVHLGGGVIGAVCVGLFATKSVNAAGATGLFYGGGYHQLTRQVVPVVAVIAYSLVLTLLISGVLNRLLGNRVSGRAEATGLDLSEHGEAAYDLADRDRPAVTPDAHPVPAAVKTQ